jgi:hypothetical protein
MLAQLSHQAIEVGERAMNLSRELGDSETLVHAQTNVGTARMIGDPDGGRALLVEAGQLALDTDLDEHACRAFHNMASMDHDLRRFERAGPVIDRALAVARQVEHRWFEADTLVLRALLDVNLGRWQAAERDRGAARHGRAARCLGGAGDLGAGGGRAAARRVASAPAGEHGDSESRLLQTPLGGEDEAGHRRGHALRRRITGLPAP